MKDKAPGNRTLTCTPNEKRQLSNQLVYAENLNCGTSIEGQVICGDSFKVARKLPQQFVDLLILDPPYNLSKNYNGHRFKAKDKATYQEWFENMLVVFLPLLKPAATVYVCSDWRTSLLIVPLIEKYFHVRNRITWEREKGRGAQSNWKNNAEDIWFCTMSNDYYFAVDAVKLKRKVLAPYRIDAQPKDWKEESGGNYRLTYPSNMWTDITVPFWSMPENTDHPTQKPEKLIAKLVLASSKERDVVFDPFLGSGTTVTIAKKLGRKFCGIDVNEEYCCWALKRLQLAESDPAIQGYVDGVFWERNTYAEQFGNRTSCQPKDKVGKKSDKKKKT